MEFIGFPKMARLSREIIITEKIDGTNANICISSGEECSHGAIDCWYDSDRGTHMTMYAGSRTRWITPENDNAGFAAWVANNVQALKGLGEGRHFGEWWGAGIQRGYGQSTKRFSLFNVSRWTDSRPECCDVVPTLYRGDFDMSAVEEALTTLRVAGSAAAPGFMRPEGIVVFHTAANVGFKKTLEKDDVPKSIIGTISKGGV